MSKKEANFDLYLHDLLVEAGIQADTQGSNIVSINDALKTASKHQTGKAGFPEYTAVVGDFVLVMEDKADRANLCLKEADGAISMTVQATTDYAVNGALHYAQHILQKTTYKKVFAFGNAGDSKHHTLQPLFVDKNGYKWLPEVQTFENFSAAHIVEYYKQIVLEETPPEDIELADILKKAKELHEYLRNYGGLGEDEKPLVVSAILLALREKEYGFNAINAKFLIPLIKSTLSIFSWGGNGATLTRLRRSKIMLPVDESGNPDYAFMEQYIKERERQIVQSYIDYTSENIQMGGALPTLNEKEWKSFLISDIFDIFPGKRLVAADTTAGNRPFIGALDNNNGVARFVSDTNESLDKNVLGVNYNGNGMVIGFYHPYECIFSDDVKRFHLKHHEDNEFVLLFMKVAMIFTISEGSHFT